MCYSCRREIAPTHSVLLTADSLMWSDPDSALLLLEQLSDVKQLKKADRALYALLQTQAQYKNYVSLRNDSLIQIAVDYYEDNKDGERLAKSYFYQGCVYAEKKELPKAIELYFMSLDKMPKGSDSIFIAMVYSHLGDCYSEQNLHSTARTMYKNGYSLCIGNDSVRACYTLKDIGDTFISENQLDSTLFYYQQALNNAVLLQNSNLLFLIYQNISTIYNDQKKYAEAGICLSKALAHLSDKNGDNYINACSTKGDILNNLEQNDSAVFYWTIGTFSSNIYVKTSSYDCLYQEYRKREDWKNATLYADSFMIYYDSIQIMNDRAELDRLMDNYQVELYKQKLTNRNQRVAACLIILFLFFGSLMAILYLRRDRKRKKEYMVLQQRLMENYARKMSLTENIDISNANSGELTELAEERILICSSLFQATEGFKRLSGLEKATPKIRIESAIIYRKIIISDVKKTFAYVMEDLKQHCPTLTNDDLFYCILSLLQYSKDVIIDIMDVSADAIKTRKNRIKNKMDVELFKRIFIS